MASAITTSRACRGTAASRPSKGDIREGDPIAGGTVYHLADRMTPARSPPRSVFRQEGENGREWWERPTGAARQKLPATVIAYGQTPSRPCRPTAGEQFATNAPSLPK